MKYNRYKRNLQKVTKLLVATGMACFLLMGATSCEYLDVVPDNVPTLDHAFANRYEAERYLYTCYSGLPQVDLIANILFFGADDVWSYENNNAGYASAWKIARGEQTVTDPFVNAWNGGHHMNCMFQGIRNCNIFLEQVENESNVPDLDFQQRKRWIAEANFLKAYYHFYLFRMYGPIPITDTNLPAFAGPEEVAVKRNSVDEVVEYISALLDKAAVNLPIRIDNMATEAGRVTKGAAYMLKAKLWATAASPLFNGNEDYANYKDNDGKALFSTIYDSKKWENVLIACEAALDSIPGVSLYFFPNAGHLSERTRYQMNLRGAVTEKWNNELIWGRSVQNTFQIQERSMVPNVDPNIARSTYLSSYSSVTLNMVERFYTENGVPIEEDKTWDYGNRYQIATAEEDQMYNLQVGYQTAKLNFNRENRYYASLSFDGGTIYMDNVPEGSDKNSWKINARFGGRQGKTGTEYFNVTGYWIKKLTNRMFVQTTTGCITESYPWPEMRLADLYLLYAEALNETGRLSDAIHYIDLVRDRSGLKGVIESWSKYSKNPNKPNSQDGLREIIHQEREIELAFEGHRVWDLRRWKKAELYQNKSVRGWNYYGKTAEDYYKVTTIYEQEFITPKDYLWPLKESELLINKNLTQNPGW